jgi:hypothetical protein
MDLLQFLSEKIKTTPYQNDRAQYRGDMIKAIINSYPPQTHIKTSELATAAGYTIGSSGIHSCIGNLIDRGEITRLGTGNGQKGYVYTILQPGNTYDEERGVADQEDEELPDELEVAEDLRYPAVAKAQRRRREAEALAKQDLVAADASEDEEEFSDDGIRGEDWPGGDVITYTFDQLEALAMRYEFYRPGSSVAEFIGSLA